MGLYAMSWLNIGAQNPSVLTYRAYPNVLQSSCTTILDDFVNKELSVLLKIEIIFIALKLRTRAEVFIYRNFNSEVSNNSPIVENANNT